MKQNKNKKLTAGSRKLPVCLLGLSVGICACHRGGGENPHFPLPVTFHCSSEIPSCSLWTGIAATAEGSRIPNHSPIVATIHQGAFCGVLHSPPATGKASHVTRPLRLEYFHGFKTPARIPIWVEVLIGLPIWKPKPVPGLCIIECMIIRATARPRPRCCQAFPRVSRPTRTVGVEIFLRP